MYSRSGSWSLRISWALKSWCRSFLLAGCHELIQLGPRKFKKWMIDPQFKGWVSVGYIKHPLINPFFVYFTSRVLVFWIHCAWKILCSCCHLSLLFNNSAQFAIDFANALYALYLQSCFEWLCLQVNLCKLLLYCLPYVVQLCAKL